MKLFCKVLSTFATIVLATTMMFAQGAGNTNGGGDNGGAVVWHPILTASNDVIIELPCGGDQTALVDMALLYGGDIGGGEGGFYQFNVRDHAANGTIADKTTLSTWTSSNPSVAAVSAPGELVFYQTGVPVNITAVIPILSIIYSDGMPVCQWATFTINFRSEVAQTYADYAGSQIRVNQYQILCNAEDTTACAPQTFPLLAPIDGVYIGSQFSCTRAPAGQEWSVLSNCWGFAGLGPFCTSYPALTIGGMPTNGQHASCTPLSAW